MIEQLVLLIRQYTALIDGLPGTLPRDLLIQCAIILPQIYSLAQQLPDVELPDDDPLKDTAGKVECPMGRIMEVLRGYDLYYEVFDPVADTDAITAMISDDLSDIYVDLKRPLIKYESGDEANQRLAIWEWKFNLQIHWGHHLVGALRPIHSLVYDHLAPDDDGEPSDD